MKRDDLKRATFDVASIALENTTPKDVVEYINQRAATDPDLHVLSFDERYALAEEIIGALGDATLSLEWDDDFCRRECPGH